jgi:hypothetical protein
MTASRWPVPFLVILPLLTLPSSALAARQCESDLKNFRDQQAPTVAGADLQRSYALRSVPIPFHHGAYYLRMRRQTPNMIGAEIIPSNAPSGMNS